MAVVDSVVCFVVGMKVTVDIGVEVVVVVEGSMSLGAAVVVVIAFLLKDVDDVIVPVLGMVVICCWLFKVLSMSSSISVVDICVVLAFVVLVFGVVVVGVGAFDVVCEVG